MQPAYDVSLYCKLFWHNYQLAVPVKPSPTIKTQPSADVFRRRGLLVYERGGFDGYYKITLLSNSFILNIKRCTVLLPYKITLLSNQTVKPICNARVLLPYKITLLSNDDSVPDIPAKVLLPYKITLLSNYAQSQACT